MFIEPIHSGAATTSSTARIESDAYESNRRAVRAPLVDILGIPVIQQELAVALFIFPAADPVPSHWSFLIRYTGLFPTRAVWSIP
jgi:hypothetical protein